MFVSISIHAEGRLLLDTSFDLTDKEGDNSRQSLRVASLIHEYTKLSIAGDSLLYRVIFQV